MIHLFKSFAARIWVLILVLIVLTGILVGTARLLLPLAETYREPLAQRLGAALGVPVHIGGLGARLAGLAPELQLTDVEIFSSGEGAPLRLAELRLRIDLLDTLRSGAPRISWATVVGARLVVRTVPGQGLLLELGAGTTPSTFSPALLFAQGRLRLLGGEVLLEQTGMAPLHLREVNARFLNAGGRHQLDLSARLDDHGTLRFHADMQGPPERPQDWYGRTYLKTEGLALGPLLTPWLPPPMAVTGILDAELWGDWNRQGAAALSGRAGVRELLLDPAATAQSLAQRLTAYLELRRNAVGDWSGGVRNLVWERAGRTREGAEFALRFQPLARASDTSSLRAPPGRLQFAAAGLWLEDIAEIATALPLPLDWRNLLVRLTPHGQIRDLRLELVWPFQEQLDWRLGGEITDFSNASWNKIPEVRGLNLQFRASPTHGLVRLRSHDLTVRFTHLFRWPLHAQRLEGDMAWRMQPDGLQLESDRLILENQDLRTRSRLSLRFPKAGGAPFIDMQSDFRDGRGAASSRYLPVGIMSKRLVAWLDHALVSGRVTSGGFVLRGPAAAFPFRKREGRFQVLFGVEDLILDYQEQWPRLEEAVAEVQFLNPGLAIELREAKLLDSQVRGARAQVADLKPARHLPISGRVVGPFSDGLRILRETPMAQRQGRYVKGMRTQGECEVTLELGVPIEPDASLQVAGRIGWRRAGLLLDDWGVALERLKGRLRFTKEGIFAQGIQASLWGEPVQLDVDTPPSRPGVPDATRIDLDLALAPAPLATHAPHWLWELLVGRAPAHLRLDIEHAAHDRSDLPLRYRLTSNLRGLAVNVPAPLGKPAAANRPFYLAGTLPLVTGSQIELGYGDIQAAFRFDVGNEGPQLVAGEVLKGLTRPPQLKHPGLHIGGRLEQLDSPAWIAWLGRYGKQLALPPATSPAPSTQVNLHIGELRFVRGALHDLDIVLTRTTDAWEGDLRAPQLAGHIRVPDLPRLHPVQARLSRLRIDLPDTSQEDEPGLAPVRPVPPENLPDPRQAPALDLHIKRLQMGERVLGQLSLRARSEATGVRLAQLQLDGPLFTLKGQGDWSGNQKTQKTSIHLEGQSPDLGKALRTLGFSSALSEADMSLQADLHWSAPPQYVNLAHLEGTLKFHLGHGRVLDVNPGVGRLFGLLNLEALQRRLTLDFSDLFSTGYAFDQIDGHFRLHGGNAFAEQMEITGPAADLAISGRIGLVAQDYDQLVTLTPAVSTTLPVAGAIAGGPVAAAALLVAGQVVGKQMNRLVRLQYRVTGPWKEPEITRIKTQDGWSLSNLLTPDPPEESTTPPPPAAELFVH